MAPDVGAIVFGRGDYRRRDAAIQFSRCCFGDLLPVLPSFLPSMELNPRAAKKNAPQQLDGNACALNRARSSRNMHKVVRNTSLAIRYLILLGCIIHRGTNGAFIKQFNNISII